MESLRTEEALIAPSEVRELLARLTSQTIEAIGPDEPRTIGGLAAKTGIPADELQGCLEAIRSGGNPRFRFPDYLMVGLIGAVLAGVLISHFLPQQSPPVVGTLQPPPPTVQPATPAPPKFDQKGLVSLTEVTYGPDSGTVVVDPSFHPSIPLPDGVSISVTIGPVLWGAGDAHGAALADALDSKTLSTLRTDLEELLEFVRKKAAARGIPRVAIPNVDGYQGSVLVETYNGSSGYGVVIPPPGKDNDPAARDEFSKAVESALREYQQQRRFQIDVQRGSGP